MGKQKGNGGMGFRDLESFNLALLAKQGWRLLKYPDSLAAVVFKEKYFRQSHFLEGKLGYQPSLIWRSIWATKDLLQEGLRWRVGDGSKIQIWGSKWLPTQLSFSVQSPVSILREDSKVDELIDKHNRVWDEGRIRAIFSCEEDEQILNIPLCKGNALDKLVWGPSKKGAFTVSSAYYLQLERLRNRRGTCSNEEMEDKRWRNIWDLEVPGVVKLFLWKA